jgi:hypothetical protein
VSVSERLSEYVSDVGETELAPDRVAGLVAPAIDRLRLAIAHALREWIIESSREQGLDPTMGMIIGHLRNLGPGRAATRAALQTVFIYHPAAAVDAGIEALVGISVLEAVADDSVRLAPRGVELVGQMHRRSDVVAEDFWGAQPQVVSLNALAGRALDGARNDGGLAFSVMAPPPEPMGATDAAILAERLTGLRFHRFDAHIAAWRGAGLTVDEVTALPPGSSRDAIEADTNRRASTPYAALSSDERLEFLGALAALRG